MSQSTDAEQRISAANQQLHSRFAPSAERSFEDHLRILLVSGGDSRIWPDPVSARNRYGTPTVPATDEVWLSSSTASAVSEHGYQTALQRLTDVLHPEAAGHLSLPELFDQIRSEIGVLYGTEGSQTVLTPSGTDAELITLFIATSLMDGPLTNIVVAPEETGSGVLMAAGGANFLNSASFSITMPKGCRLAGWESADIAAAAVAIRTPAGDPRAAADIDADAARLAADALADGRNVLLHILDTSKTGLTGLSRETAAQIAALAPGRVLVVVDACQLRCPADRLRSDLERGFMVQITGSKFAGGPAFCGALMLPGQIVAALPGSGGMPQGLASYSALLDWPDGLRPIAAETLHNTANMGLALRWTAALADLSECEAIDIDIRDRFFRHFEQFADDVFSASQRLEPLCRPRSTGAACRSIVPLKALLPDGSPASFEEAANLHDRLRRPDDMPAVHLGQPVALGPVNVLRVCASAQHVVAFANRLRDCGNFETAFAPLAADIETAARKLDGI